MERTDGRAEMIKDFSARSMGLHLIERGSDLLEHAVLLSDVIKSWLDGDESLSACISLLVFVVSN